ncbi:MAG: hypothetical protein HRU72_15115 [Planctomycetia bacterium]|uniref:HIRAN domain-containing protein n=1 Tax=Candidatus Brocadia sapporoensis TaxID=392547 RepID=A0A1V6M335_9BACT|nr:hypothetical protein [Candidatus Brocadia sapporoensis]MCC7238901.1 hypothetical protein [Candidatus Brocadia sp.]QOJ07777.1 MAG: hypothetical protein HRU72_15115 [Planctomycetia bacterium]TVL98338.1 MAG: hypothetical protein CV082_01010 [Candidatus Brocadia sp. BL1]MDG6004673.1 hypothetical protein [Candidatus Brocadia sp.]OQD46803.1 hypothetical protein BIY37_01260 [Candidatus Brocadia sapporoensis]
MIRLKTNEALVDEQGSNDNVVILVHESDNQHDEKTIAIETESFGMLGYVKRSAAKVTCTYY